MAIFREASLLVPFNCTDLPLLSVTYDTISFLMVPLLTVSFVLNGIIIDGVFCPAGLPAYKIS